MCGIWFSLGFAPDPAHIESSCASRAGRQRLESVRQRGRAGRARSPPPQHHRPLGRGASSRCPMPTAGIGWSTTARSTITSSCARSLRQQGHPFRTQSDTEVLLAAYAQWGEAALDRLVGMFAFVLWDQQEQIAFAARDHFGIKPLYLFVTSARPRVRLRDQTVPGSARVSPHVSTSPGPTISCPPASWSIPTRPCSRVCVSCAAANACASIRSTGVSATTLPVRRWYRILEPGTLDDRRARGGRAISVAAG